MVDSPSLAVFPHARSRARVRYPSPAGATSPRREQRRVESRLESAAHPRQPEREQRRAESTEEIALPTPGRCSALRACAPTAPPKSLASLAQGGVSVLWYRLGE